MKLKGRVALITGGGRAIGRRIALQLARDGADIVLLGTEVDELRSTAEEARALGRNSVTVIADVSVEKQVTAAVNTAQAELKQIDILVNNAAIIGPTAPVHEIRRVDWDEVLAVNLTGAFLCAKAVLPGMIQRRSGKIINISSVAGKQAYALRSPYAVSKWGLIGLTLTLAKEAGPHHIQVNAVCPGPIEGARMRGIIAKRAQELSQPLEQVERAYVSAAALGRMAREEDVAGLVAFLASPEADNITGQAIDVSAGYGL